VAFGHSTSAQISGKVFADYGPAASVLLTIAVEDMQLAYTDAATRNATCEIDD
jgi:hypothetical protein